jgi:glycosyltransferase involved in cell wall biosynthesis
VRICAIIKYPPIQGGVSAQGYWLARGLAERGHQVEVVTNAMEVEDTFRLRLTAEDSRELTPSFDNGGRVSLHTPEVFSPKLTHIPQANPFVSKLAGLATRVIRDRGCEVIFSYYLEPNGVAAHLASAWTGQPYVVQHAGSDLGRLMKQPGLDTTYLEVFRRADGICTGSPYTFVGMGASPESVYRHPPFYLPEGIFTPEAEPLDLDAHIAEIEAQLKAEGKADALHNPGPLDPQVATVGIYGKMGEAKGSYDLLAALARLRQEGRRFNFVAVTSGREMERYRRAVKENDLEDCTWVLPFMAHWRVPRFLRACDGVCFLERDFPIAFHAPTIPREVLSCGTCLVLSGEILAKQPYRERMVDGESFLLVSDPKDHSVLAGALRRIVDDREGAREIGRRGVEVLSDRPSYETHAEAYEALLADVVARRAGRPSAFGPADRGFAEDRMGALKRLAAPLVKELDAAGTGADEALLEHLAAHPQVPPPHEDARLFAAAWSSRPVEGEAGECLRDAARYTELLVWMGSLEEGEEAVPRFSRLDELPQRGGGGWVPEVVRSLAPLASRWMRLARFRYLPGRGAVSSEGGASAGDEEAVLLFHKLPSLTGHHFRVNAFTARVLEACDGEVSVGELIEGFAGESGRAPREVARALAETLRRFYREGLIVFVEPAAP